MEQNSKKRYRVIVADFHQETNSFNPNTWTFENFRQDTFLEGAEIPANYGENSGRVLCGILETARRYDAEIIPAIAMRSTSGGTVDHAVVEYFTASLLACLKQHKPVDALILSLHGATQSTAVDDVCGHILEALRKAAGPAVLIAAGCDMHANVTEKCMEQADYICGFQTYPHVDQRETGIRAAELVFRKLKTGARNYTARLSLPMIVPASGYSTETSPLREIMAYGHELVRQGTLLDFTVFQMQPWLDVWPAGSSIVTVAEEAAQAERCAKELAERLFRSRDAFWPKLYQIGEVIEQAKSAPAGKPVILVDFADSLGAGATGESAAVLSELAKRNYPVRTAMIVSDRAAVERATSLGVGAVASFAIGCDGIGMEQVPVTAEVLSLRDGVFYQEGPVAKGQRRNIGRTAVLRVENVDVLVCEYACCSSDLQAYRSFGIEPTDYQMVAVKANTSFRAAYTPISSKICMTDTPGVSTSHLERLPYSHISRHFYPFEHLDGYEPGAPQVMER